MNRFQQQEGKDHDLLACIFNVGKKIKIIIFCVDIGCVSHNQLV